MKVQQTFTFIVSRNFGHPITWNVQAWRVYVGGALALALLLAMALLSSLYLLSFPRLHDLERERQELELERDALRDELHAQSQSAYDAKVEAWEGVTVARGAAAPNPADPDPAALDESQYITPIRVDSFTARASGRTVEAAFRIVSQGDPSRDRGGFLFAIFEDHSVNPPRYVASPHVDVNEEGFPQLYKAGIRYSRVRHAQTYRRSITKSSPDETFTHCTVYLFSLRGGLVVKERYALDPELFTASL